VPTLSAKPPRQQTRGTDFLSVVQLAELTGFTPKTIYHQNSTRHGALVPILCKLGRRLGAWRADYAAWVAQQRKLPDPTT